MSTKFAIGDDVPWFRGPVLDGLNQFSFDLAAGRYVLLLFVGSAGHAPCAEALRLLAGARHLFDDNRACFFGFTSDPSDAAGGRIEQQLPGIRWYLDYDRKIARQFGAADEAGRFTPYWLLLDKRLRVLARAGLPDSVSMLRHLERLVALPAPAEFAPVLVVPDVFPRNLCRALIDRYETHGGEPSGFMRDVNGVTSGMLDSSIKRRSDCELEGDDPLRDTIKERFRRTLLPQIQRAFQFNISRIERYIVACYDGQSGGYFRKHRDNTSAGTSHRRFACSINLNAEDYEGGDLRFPEFGRGTYRAPTGGAVIFSCSLLHEALPVTRGKRYAYLPFFYDEAAAKQREEVARKGQVAPELATYRA